MFKKSKMIVSSLVVTSMCLFVFTSGVSANEGIETDFEQEGYLTYDQKNENTSEEIEDTIQEKEEEGYVTYNLEPVNESTMELRVNNANITSNSDGSVEIQSHKNEEQVTLPSNAVDKKGNEVKIQYELLNDNTIEIQVVDPASGNVIQTASWQDGLQCGLGVAGTGGTTALAGFGGFGIPGAVVGAVAGGMVGAQAACFD